MEIPLFSTLKMLKVKSPSIAASTAALFQNARGTPKNTPPSKDGNAGNFRATATITNTGGSKAITLILEDPSINEVISFSTVMSTALLEACVKPNTANTTNAITIEVPVV